MSLARRRVGEMYCQPNQILWHLCWKQAWSWDSNSCFNRLCWCNWPLGRNRLKTKKTDNNYKTKWCSGQQPQNHLVLYTTGTDSIQSDRPLSKKDWLKTKRQTQNKRLTRYPSQDLQNSVSPMLKNACQTLHQKCTKCCPQAVHFTYSQYLSPRNPTTEWWRACLRWVVG